MGKRDQRAANVAYYHRNRAQETQRVRARQAATVEFLRGLRRVPCGDCGRRFEPYQMDFDHRDPSEKRFRVTAGRVMLLPRDRLLAEIAKCDVVCANCHRMRTRQRADALMPRIGTSKYLERKRAMWQAHARLLDELRSAPCADCGGRFPPCAMDFDHRDPATKRSAVTRLIGRAGVGRILAEAAECAIVCANCHRLRTFERRSQLSARE